MQSFKSDSARPRSATVVGGLAEMIAQRSCNVLQSLPTMNGATSPPYSIRTVLTRLYSVSKSSIGLNATTARPIQGWRSSNRSAERSHSAVARGASAGRPIWWALGRGRTGNARPEARPTTRADPALEALGRFLSALACTGQRSRRGAGCGRTGPATRGGGGRALAGDGGRYASTPAASAPGRMVRLPYERR